MFGLFSRKTQEPLELEGTATIHAPAALIFNLIDFSSPANRLAARGFQFTEKAARLGQFAATDPNLPDVHFEFEVDLYDEARTYGFFSKILADPPFGGFDRNREEFHIEALDDRHCRVTLKTKNWYRQGMKGHQRRNEEALMTQAVAQDLMKLKVEAEALVKERAA
ncbi:hypothetical protein [Hyphococcus sp.]|uniref:hypothetical protein n=1 Tax=Hyphococcus sp. TaxID=2038636 RepID=UPI0035C77196